VFMRKEIMQPFQLNDINFGFTSVNQLLIYKK
jgi:hypothetical protein